MSLYKIRHILVGVDMSETSLNALDTAASLARMHGARLSIIWVKDNSFDFLEGDSNTLIGNIDDSSEDILTAMAAGIQHRFDIEPQIIKEEGSVPHRIVYQSLQLQCDLVVMGTHGASGYRACFTGNSTYTVLKYAMCPVLCVPPQKNGAPSKISYSQSARFRVRFSVMMWYASSYNRKLP